MRKIAVRALTMSPVLAFLMGASSVSADYPPGGGIGSTPSLPATGASMAQDASTIGGWAVAAGLALLAVLAVRRRSSNS